MLCNLLSVRALGPEAGKKNRDQGKIRSPGEMFTTKIQFVKPQQRKNEESPCSIDSQDKVEELPVVSILKPSLVNLNYSQKQKNFKRAEIKENKQAKALRNTEKHHELVEKAKAEILSLRTGNRKLREKLEELELAMMKIEENKCNDLLSLNSIEHKLEKLENQQLIPEEDSRFPEAVQKLSFLESEIVKLKSLKESSVFQYEEQLKDVYHKLKDLQECNEILTEMVSCFKKEPIYSERDIKNAESMTDKAAKEILGTIKVSGLADSEDILKEAYEKKNQLLLMRSDLEKEYKSIPDDNNNMAYKRKKLALEFELSMNNSQLVSINNKIKRYVPDV